MPIKPQPQRVQSPHRNWWQRNWKWCVPVIVITPVLLCGGFFTLIFSFVFGMMKNSEPYQHSLKLATNNAQIQAVIGTPIKPSFFITGNINITNNNGNADLSYSLTGPKGSVQLDVVAQKQMGTWSYTRCDAKLPQGPLDLLPQPTDPPTNP